MIGANFASSKDYMLRSCSHLSVVHWLVRVDIYFQQSVRTVTINLNTWLMIPRPPPKDTPAPPRDYPGFCRYIIFIWHHHIKRMFF
jgi:hypothetical protein